MKTLKQQKLSKHTPSSFSTLTGCLFDFKNKESVIIEVKIVLQSFVNI